MVKNRLYFYLLKGVCMDFRVILILIAETLFAFFLLMHAGVLKSRRAVLVSVLLVAAAFTVRGLCLDYMTLDYKDFLSKWVDFYRQNGGFKALHYPLGNYNIPYLYFLCLFSYSSINDLYLIKLLSIFFDVLLAYGAMMLLSKVRESIPARIACFFTVLFLPTVILNGSLWSQCDSIYVSLALLAIYFALDDRPILSVLCFTLSFGFKLQAVFLLPAMAVLWLKGKYKLWHFLLFPVFYVLLVLPAVALGKPFLETLTLYASQTGSIGDGLNYNSPSVYAFFQYDPNVTDLAATSRIGIIAAFVFMGVILVVCAIKRHELTNGVILAVSVLFAVGIPFLLPHMHDRYFFAADVLTVVMAYAYVKYSAAAPLTQFASLLGYHAYLKMRYLLLMDHGARALIVVLMLSIVLFVQLLSAHGDSHTADTPIGIE